jgi:2-keto-4-pentenoate hydratase/2-oxohepta-3-ene-1,7-dioic acid hydratase in catechol pathway
MKISRFSLNDDIFYGMLNQSKVTRLISLSNKEIVLESTGETYHINDLIQLPPVNPSEIYGVGDNYPRSREDQSTPIIFKKSADSIVTNHSTVILPVGKEVWPEPEIGIVLKKALTGLNQDNFENYILGYVLVNDVTCITPGLETDTHSDESKNQPGFCPIGSFIQTEFNFSKADIFSEINKTPYRNGNAKLFKWSIVKLLDEVSYKYNTSPGDLVITGCPARLKLEKTFLRDGDIFTSKVEGLGELITAFEKELL